MKTRKSSYSKVPLSRRHLLQAAAAGGALSVLNPRLALAQGAPESSVLVVFLRGGYNALFSSADSFAPAGTFGVTSTNMRSVGNGLFLDNATYGTLPAPALERIAAVGIAHGSSSHDTAQNLHFTNNGRSYVNQLAAAIGGTAPILSAAVGEFPPGNRTAEGPVSMQQITNLSSTIAALGGGAANPDEPQRVAAAAAVRASREMSAAALQANANSLRSASEAYEATVKLLEAPVKTFNYSELTTAYGVAATSTAVNSFTMKMLAAELMMTAGARVVVASDGGWDTHGDRTGASVRRQMTAEILPGLRIFLQRMLANPARNVTVAVIGEFARSLPGSDHARVTSATVIGPRIRVGTTGKVTANVGLPSGTPGVSGLWALLAAAAGVSAEPFGRNPHTSLLLT